MATDPQILESLKRAIATAMVDEEFRETLASDPAAAFVGLEVEPEIQERVASLLEFPRLQTLISEVGARVDDCARRTLEATAQPYESPKTELVESEGKRAVIEWDCGPKGCGMFQCSF